MEVTFWGVRGTIACPGPDHLRYGGNTSCVELRVGGERIIFDAGTGLRLLGRKMMAEGPSASTLLLSHCHWDHISGFPFFTPAFLPHYRFKIMAGHLRPPQTIQSIMAGQMVAPFFPVPLEHMAADLNFHDFAVGESVETLGGLRVHTAPLNHPDGATAYRVEADGLSVCYVTDTEHRAGELDQTILRFIDGADLVIYDATYTDETYPNYVGWGHSTWQEGIKLARAANVKQLALFHHNPDHPDAEMDRIAADAYAVWDGAFAAREGDVIRLG